MRSITPYVTILLLAFSCEETRDKNPHELSALPVLISRHDKSYPESLDAWNELKATNGNSYVYQTSFTSLSGFGNTTEIRVYDGVVTTRIYQEFQVSQSDGEKTITFSYREDRSDVGSNDKGATPLTIDELYDTCAKDFLTADTETNTVYFQTSSEGLMTICAYVPSGCVDDCYNGIRIHSFGWLD